MYDFRRGEAELRIFTACMNSNSEQFCNALAKNENYIRYAISPKSGIFSPDWQYTSNLMYD